MTSDVIAYPRGVSRWEPDAGERLREAALQLFAEQGFAPTTVAQITARANLTTRTFFRHFADKREVIFGGDEIPELARRMMGEAVGDPIQVLADGLITVAGDKFDGRREEVRFVRRLIKSDESLRERDLAKRSALGDVIRDGLRARGIPTITARVLAELTVSILHAALDEWLDREDDQPLAAIVATTFADLASRFDRVEALPTPR